MGARHSRAAASASMQAEVRMATLRSSKLRTNHAGRMSSRPRRASASLDFKGRGSAERVVEGCRRFRSRSIGNGHHVDVTGKSL